MTSRNTDALMALGLEMAAAAREIVLSHYGRLDGFEDKADGSPVTAADREVEADLRKRIEAAFPDHGIYGEEYGQDRIDADFVWVIDPIDGTKSFVSGKPLFGTLIGLMQDGKAVLGVMEMAALGETWSGAAGQGAQCNGIPVKTRPCSDLGDAWMHSTSPRMHEGLNFDRFERLRRTCKQTLHGSDCYGFATVARGRSDMVCESSMSPYDYVAVAAIVEAAGGTTSDWSGKPLGLAGDGTVLASGDAAAHEKALEILAG